MYAQTANAHRDMLTSHLLAYLLPSRTPQPRCDKRDLRHPPPKRTDAHRADVGPSHHKRRRGARGAARRGACP